jgi:DNA replication initiation complex subunit (GINS family)
MTEVVITYETLYELLRREKSREELQKLEENFIDETQKYLNEKQDIIKKAGESLFANDERRKTQTQIDNARRIIKELYHKREQKIVCLALDANKTGSKIAMTSSMLILEKELYEKIFRQLEESKYAMLGDMVESRRTISAEEKPKDLKDTPESNKHVRFTEEIPKFMGTDLNVYGPYIKESEAELPMKIAELLLKKGKAEEIQ